MTDLERLHRAILLDPWDDVARLAYADALEESGKQGQARKANVIRDGLRFRGMAYRTTEPWMFAKKVSALDYLRKQAPPTNDIRAISVDLTVSRGLPFKWQCALEDFVDGAAILFSTYPLTEVALTDREPSASGGSATWRKDDGGWDLDDSGFGLGPVEGQSLLPAAIYDLLPAMTARAWTVYLSRQAAIAALSAACVAHGRALAGLPALPPLPVCPTPAR